MNTIQDIRRMAQMHALRNGCSTSSIVNNDVCRNGPRKAANFCQPFEENGY